MSASLLTIQEDCVGRLLASPLFNDVAVFEQRKALTESEINKLLQTLKGRSGKIGTCVMVQMPVMDVPNPNLPGPSVTIVQSFLVIEHPTLNATTQGTGKSAEYLAEQVLQLFHHFVPFGVTQVFNGGQNAIVPTDQLDGLAAYVVTVTTALQLRIPSKVVRPTIAKDADTAPTNITLACATVGAAIYYTTDGSYPSSANEAATLYSAPFAQVTPATIRAAAELAGSQQSDIAQISLS